ncbi:Calx-beta domain-containing protein [Gemmata sp. JC717]|uniref:Calx-beta domain-containing protein n=1 Tax=Gemmata algarum TaxID=2975278 RepID=UPI0021BB9BA9|nr:Calx-beta domain-containing protein [Gemmata algarum]MDY3554378.1 Calx-beta domain-containing protein [Gemmata algarum]
MRDILGFYRCCTTTSGFTAIGSSGRGHQHILIANDGADAVVGTFAGLPEGASFTAGGVTFTISYVGGTGNDVVVTVGPPAVSIGNVTAAEGNAGGTSFTFTVTLSTASTQTVTVSYATVAGTATAGADYTPAAGTLTFAPGETSKTVTVLGDTTVEPDETFTVVLSNPTNATIGTGTGTGTITNDDAATATVISGGGAPGTVRPINPATGQPGDPIVAFAGFTGEVRVASGDVNGDGRADTVAGAGAGAPGGHVKVFSSDGTLYSFLAFPGFSGGVFVSTGDVNGDGFADIVVSADAGATPHVKVFSGKDGAQIQSFFAYDAAFRGGVRVSTGDVNGDGFADIITGSGAGAPTNVKVFSGRDNALLRSFAPYGAYAGGVYVGAGDVNGDGLADIITGSGPGTVAHVKVFSGRDNAQLQSFFAYDAGFLGGVRVGSGKVNGRTAVLTGAGPGAGPHFKAFVDGTQVLSLLAGDPFFSGGVYIG